MRSILTVAAAAAAGALLLAGAAGATTGTLPGGTPISVAITTPADGATLPLGDVPVTGTASVGTGIAVANTLLITVIDVSGSTVNPGGTCPNQNPAYDSEANTILDCELLAAKTLNDAAAASGTVAQVGLVGFGGTVTGPGQLTDAAALALDPVTHDALVAPGASDGNGPYADQVLASAYLGARYPQGAPYDGFDLFVNHHFGGDTNFWAAVEAVKALAESATVAHTNTLVAFLSDGISNRGGPSGENAAQAVADLNSAVSNVKIDTFAIGASGGCSGGTYGSLQDIADGTGGTCSPITDPTDAASIVPDVIASQLTGISLTVDGSPVAVTPDTTLPAAGPVSVGFSGTLSSPAAGPHELCATAAGSDGGGSDSVEDCVDITVNSPPVCSAVTVTPDALWPANHKLVTVQLSGATDPDTGDSVSYQVDGVTQDEPLVGGGSGSTTPDAVLAGDGSVQLRAERDGAGNGRVYTIAYTVTDSHGATCSGTVTVGVPHDHAHTAVPGPDGPFHSLG